VSPHTPLTSHKYPVNDLDLLAQEQDWAALAAVLRRITEGDRDDRLLEGLDTVNAAIAGEVLARLAQSPGNRPAPSRGRSRHWGDRRRRSRR